MKASALFSIGCLVTVMSSGLAQPVYRVDPDFNPVITQPSGSVKAVLVQSDGRIYVAGSFAAIDGVFRPGLARLKATGGVDESFPAALAGGDEIFAAMLQSDGKILVAGYSRRRENQSLFRRINLDGGQDAGFQADLPAYWLPEALLVQSDGKIIVSLQPPDPGPVPSLIVRLDSAGRRDGAFTQVELNRQTLEGMALQPDGRILIWGYFTAIDGEAHVGIARLNSDGSLDPTFRHTLESKFPESSDVGVQTVTVMPDGKLHVTGSLKGGNHLLNPDGSVAAAGVNGLQGALGPLLPDGGVLQLGAGEIWKLMPDGETLDESFATTTVEVPGQVGKMIQQLDGKIVITGAFSHVNGVPRAGLARLNLDGSVDHSFVPDSDLPSFAGFDGSGVGGLLRYQPWDGRLIVLGTGEAVNRPVRLMPDGSRDPDFNPPEFPDSWIIGLEPHSDGTLYVSYSARNQQGGVIRLKADGSVDPGFNYHKGSGAILLQNDGKLLFDGDGLIRLNVDGSRDTGFVPNLNWGGSSHILVQPDGKIVLVGPLGDGQLKRLNADGSTNSSFGPSTSPGSLWIGGRIDDIALVGGDRIVVFGDISSLDARSGTCLFDNCDSANLVILNSSGHFDGLAGRLKKDQWNPGEFRWTRRALPMSDGGFLLAGYIAQDNSPFGFELIRVAPAPVIQSSQRNPDGSVGLRIGGLAGWTYALEASANLVDWSPLRDVPSAGLSTPVLDTPPAGESQRFYRALSKQ